MGLVGESVMDRMIGVTTAVLVVFVLSFRGF